MKHYEKVFKMKLEKGGYCFDFVEPQSLFEVLCNDGGRGAPETTKNAVPNCLDSLSWNGNVSMAMT